MRPKDYSVAFGLDTFLEVDEASTSSSKYHRRLSSNIQCVPTSFDWSGYTNNLPLSHDACNLIKHRFDSHTVHNTPPSAVVIAVGTSKKNHIIPPSFSVEHIHRAVRLSHLCLFFETTRSRPALRVSLRLASPASSISFASEKHLENDCVRRFLALDIPAKSGISYHGCDTSNLPRTCQPLSPACILS